MIVGGIDRVAGARNGLPQVVDEAEIRIAVPRNIVFQIHHLNAEIEPLDRGVGGLRGHGILLAKDRRLAVDQERGAGAGIDDDGFADDDPLKRLQLDSQRHRRLPFLGYAGTTTLDLFGASLAGIRSKRGAIKSGERLVRRRRGLPRRRSNLSRSRTQRSSWSTLCCDWLASDSADTAIDWRVDSAWLLAASALVSASVRLDEPVCSTLIRFFEKSCRICTIDRFEPSVDASVRSVLLAVFSEVRALLAEVLSRKSVPAVNLDRLRPAMLKVTPWIFSVEVPVSLKVSLS